jgi:peptide/bleomycin uptake transporter
MARANRWRTSLFRSFFPVPRLFFSSVVIWLLFSVLVWFTVGNQIRAGVSIDRFVVPPICAAAPAAPAANPAGSPAASVTPGAAPSAATPADTNAGATPANAAASNPSAQAPAGATPAPAAATNCIPKDQQPFLNGDRIWLYEYVLLTAIIFCVFWYFYKRNAWYWWSVVGSAGILLVIYINVQINAWVNDWQGIFFDILQKALSQPGSVDPGTFYRTIIQLFVVLMPYVVFLILNAFFTSHYIFRWRTAMNHYYMSHWPRIRTTEGAAQRIQEDTMRFASTLEDLGTTFFSSLITLVVFLPILWQLSTHITQLPILGPVPGSLVWVALLAAIFGTIVLAGVGVRLPGLNFNIQRVEAAYRKELVYGEDDPSRAAPPSVADLFGSVRSNYFRLYFHYTYFNLARYVYINLVGYVPLLAMSPSILAGAITLGIYQQVQNAYDQVSSSFQFFAQSWPTIVELMSIRKRLVSFESNIPSDSEYIAMASLPGAAE